MRTICSAQYCKGNVPAISAKSCGFRKQAPKILPPPAFRDYLLGRFYWNKRNEEGLLKSVEFFNRAIARDPQYARAYSGLADAYLVLGGGYLPDLETYDKART